ncbi:MAG: ACT domain-containing protein, partial [Candidatus Micrarchaeota archaeon]
METKLEDLLKNINPELQEGKHYFASVPESQLFGLVNYLSSIKCIQREEEGLSIVFSEDILEEMKDFSE